MAVIFNRLCRLVIYRLRLCRLRSKTAELSQDVRTGSVALLAIYQKCTALFIYVQMICLTAQGTGSGNMSARLCFYTG